MSSEVSGYPLKEAVKKYLLERGYEIKDVGYDGKEAGITYIDAAKRLVPYIQSGECERGLIFCGSGAGVGVTANKFKGIYCVISESIYTAPKAAQILNANVLAVGAKVVGEDNACEMCDLWLKESFCGGFDEEKTARVSKMFETLQETERENFK